MGTQFGPLSIAEPRSVSGGSTPSCAHDCEGTDLAGAIASRINLIGDDFTSADLSGV